ncbi:MULTISPECIES: type II secretion system inner membrane protein GspF [Burkholderia]|jgi:general secretion pathway protein F|uniref:Type II secretion system inner membrane protein GspF n=2 Tax=Burkholderia gladioli TaxID=28095 RepID=A0A095W5J8_BURGA|nr:MULTISPECIES: type II secretion system inner membrane protein GspF [Burkholderia]AEA58750.1 General secretion pathway protein F [Burkholderia gladioli BSR3]AJX00636.1 type II secretion system protein F [Burkholderia gladioli]ASD77586.1 type II secretion system protein GspF [Burkholderia gladioli pv. gladioli]ATF85965.1 type II secretion system protein GspF [Burkholderia gladioli pv. gladioli]AWY53500.1 type II secretion system protein GspF [Burkholderia gladioli pv. gladioli]
MPAFRFEAIDSGGRPQKGVIEADSARAARGQLRGQGLTPLVVEPAASRSRGQRKQRLSIGRKLSQREQAILTRQLASLLTAGLPLGESLAVLTEQAERDYIRELMAAIRAEVLGGHSLASALAEHPRDFPEIYRALVSAGEHTGKLGIVLSRLADYIEQRNALKQKIVLAFTYPGIVTLIAFGIVTFLLSYVVPQVVNVFASTKQQLPFLTIVMMALSDFVRHWWWAMLIGVVVLAWIVKTTLSRAGPRLAFDRWLLGAPLAGKLVRGYNTVRFASTLAILTAAGVPILRALQAAGETLSNRAMSGNIDDAIVRVREGTSLSRALNHVKTFPPVLVHLIRSGEATGDVTTMLDRAAEGEARELERRTMFMTSLLEPLLILAMGGIVLVIVLAVMLPIIELNNMVQ